MSVSMGDFIGAWTVKWVDGESPFLQSGWQIYIGTGTEGDSTPSLTPEYQVVTGFTILDPSKPTSQQTVLSTSQQDDYHQPLLLMLVDGNLRWTGYYSAKPLRIFISLSEVTTEPNQTRYLSLYGSTTWGDPDQVGVWGADGNPQAPPHG